ncbi:MAG: RNA pseudouridine synthase [bacterium]|nr:RNA pseudouridine synthase [bacterium]
MKNNKHSGRRGKRFFVTAKKETVLLDLLNQNLPPDCSPEAIISSGGVWKDRKRLTNPDFTLAAGDTVKVNICNSQGEVFTLEKKKVIFENRDLLVVYKPCNLNVHGVPTSFQNDLTYGVNTYLREQGLDYESTPITRLDRPVEGLVIFAKNKSMERKLFELIKERRIKKWYLAGLEKGESIAPCRRIRDRISNYDNRTNLDADGKFADSLFIKGESLETADVYSVFIFTGRRHQIRFHASHYISPVKGDRFYGASKDLPPDEIALMCFGYNIPYRRTRIKVRLPEHYRRAFLEKIESAKKS